MTESIATHSEDLKSKAFVHHIESNFDKVKNYYCIIYKQMYKMILVS